MEDVRKLIRIQLLTIVVFAIAKFSRPSILASEAPEWLKVVFLSLPNFFEAIVGITVLCALGLVANHRMLLKTQQLQTNHIYLLAVVLTAIYVITQEFKIHNLGGNNVYDPYDVAFSILGLLVGYVILRVLKPKISA